MASLRYPAPRAFRHGHAVRATYDAKHDKTVLRLDPVRLESSLAISTLVALDGAPVRVHAPGVTMTVWSTARTRRFAAEEDREIRLRLPDSRVLALRRGWPVPTPAEGFTEVLITSMPTGRFLELVSWERAELTVGPLSVPLPPDLLEAFREFASRMAPGVRQEWSGQ